MPEKIVLNEAAKNEIRTHLRERLEEQMEGVFKAIERGGLTDKFYVEMIVDLATVPSIDEETRRRLREWERIQQEAAQQEWEANRRDPPEKLLGALAGARQA